MNLSSIQNKVAELEAEMRRIGYWSEAEAPNINESKLFGGVTFEAWLQFVFLPKVAEASSSGDLSEVPAHRIGVAALRQYDYHSLVEEAHPLMHLCFDLEKLLPQITC